MLVFRGVNDDLRVQVPGDSLENQYASSPKYFCTCAVSENKFRGFGHVGSIDTRYILPSRGYSI